MYRVLITSEVEKTRLTKREHKVIGQEQAADGESLIDTVENYDEFYSFFKDAGYGKMLDE